MVSLGDEVMDMERNSEDLVQEDRSSWDRESRVSQILAHHAVSEIQTRMTS